MKILLIQEADWLTKGPHHQHHLMDRLSRKSNKIKVIDFETSWRFGKSELCSKRVVYKNVSRVIKDANVEVIRPSLLKIPLFDVVSLVFTHFKEIYHQVITFQPDVILGMGLLNNYFALKFSKQKSIPFVYYILDELHTLVPYGFFTFFAKFLEKKIISGSDGVIVINEKLRDFVIDLGGDPKTTFVLPAGVDCDFFNAKNLRSKIRNFYDIKRDDCVLLFMGTIFDFSGILELTNELAENKGRYPKIKILIVGKAKNPKLDIKLREIIKKCSLKNQIFLVGRQQYDKIPSFVAASDICLLPALKNEVMMNIVPIKMYEYMVCAKPVISTKLPGVVKEFAYNNGVLYVNHPNEILKRVSELMCLQDDLQRHGLKAKLFAGRYSWNTITDRFKDLLERIIKNSSNRTNIT